MADHRSRLATILREHEAHILTDWTASFAKAGRGGLDRAEVEEQAGAFVRLLSEAMSRDGAAETEGPAWAKVREMLTALSSSRARQGRPPSETATFVFSLKKPLFARLREEFRGDAEGLARELWTATELLDKLGLYTTEVYQKTREEVIARQQQEMLELSTPVVKLWDGILALPLIGTLDSARTQVVMETLLQTIVETGAGDRHHRHHRACRRWTPSWPSTSSRR